MVNFGGTPKRPDERSLWNSKIELGEKFYNEIISHPVPDRHEHPHGAQAVALGLDLYLWLVYRTFPLARRCESRGSRCSRQFGVEPDKANDRVTVDNFRKDCLRELKKINLAWPGLNYSTAPGLLILLLIGDSWTSSPAEDEGVRQCPPPSDTRESPPPTRPRLGESLVALFGRMCCQQLGDNDDGLYEYLEAG